MRIHAPVAFGHGADDRLSLVPLLVLLGSQFLQPSHTHASDATRLLVDTTGALRLL